MQSFYFANESFRNNGPQMSLRDWNRPSENSGSWPRKIVLATLPLLATTASAASAVQVMFDKNPYPGTQSNCGTDFYNRACDDWYASVSGLPNNNTLLIQGIVSAEPILNYQNNDLINYNVAVNCVINQLRVFFTLILKEDHLRSHYEHARAF